MSTNPQRLAAGAERGFARNPSASKPAARHPAARDFWWFGLTDWMCRRRIYYRKYCCGSHTFAARRRLLRWLIGHRTNERE